MRYMPFEVQGLSSESTDSLWYAATGLEGHEARMRALRNLTVSTTGQFNRLLKNPLAMR